jgi:alpha-galactosidase
VSRGRLTLNPVAVLWDGRRVPLDIETTRERSGGAMIMRSRIRHTGKRPIRIKGIELFREDIGPNPVEVFRQGFYMPSDPSGFSIVRAGEKAPRCSQHKNPALDEWEFSSHTLAVFKAGRARMRRLIGFVSGTEHEGIIVFDTRGKTAVLKAWCPMEGIRLDPGEWRDMEPLAVGSFDDLNAALDCYTALALRETPASVPSETVTGWSDWQYYRHAKTEEDVLTSMEALDGLNREGASLRHIVIDDGFCKNRSEWLEETELFASGIPHLARELHKRKMKLGLWLAPFIANIKTKAIIDHPEWLMKNRKTGKALSRPNSNVGPCNIIDFTVPGALEWMEGVVKHWVTKWGVEYIKLDGPALSHYRDGKLHDEKITRVQMVRRVLKMIRNAAGPGVLIEGEGIYGPSVGMVDVQRTTQDSSCFWHHPVSGNPALKENMKNDLLSGFLHNRFWHNHRENVILRDFLSPHHARQAVSPGSKDMIIPGNEMLLQISALALTGGAMLLTDPMDQLLRNPAKKELISQFLPHHEEGRCRPLDTFQGGRQPSLYVREVAGDGEPWYLLGCFNWEDGFENYEVDLTTFAPKGTWHAFDFWNQEYLGRHRGSLAVRDVSAHGCKVIALRKVVSRPQFIGSNIHLYQGAVGCEETGFDRNTLRIDIDHWYQKDRTITLWHPSRFALKSVETNAKDHLVDTRVKDLITIHFNGRKKTTFSLTWNEKTKR